MELNGQPRFASLSERCLKDNQAIHSFKHSSIHCASVSLHDRSLQMQNPMMPQSHWVNYPLCVTTNRSLCVRCLASPWSQWLSDQNDNGRGLWSNVKTNSLPTGKANKICPRPTPSFLSAQTEPLAEARFQKHTWDYIHITVSSSLDVF